METLPIRLSPGQDLRGAIEEIVAGRGCSAAFVLAGIGSLSQARLRLAGADDALPLSGDIEIITLSGTIAAGASHLHAALATSNGTVIGGHVAPGCIVRTTAEVLLALLPIWSFTREPDAQTGFAELVVRPHG
jgi:uncharacterized protein